jgi:hypothetical protein
MNGPIPVPPVDTITITTALLNVGPGSNPAAYVPNPGPIANSPDATKGNVASVWGYVGLIVEAPSQTSQPPITCAVYGQGGVVGVNGFRGTIADPDASGDGVIGFGSANGVHGIGTSGTGVAGTSTGGSGVAGTSENGTGVKGISTNGVGVAGESKSTASIGDRLAGSGGPAGIFGTSNRGDGVHGESQSSKDSGVAGINNSGGHGVFGRSSGGEGVHGESIGGYGVYATSDKTAGYFQGDVTVTGKLTAQGDVGVDGTLTAKVDVVLGSDCAEDFDIAPSAEIDPGTVMVLTDNGAVQPSQNAYDKKVAGVISGAGDYRPGLILGRCDSSQQRMPLALVGKVYCKADARYAPIEIGDLLTTSPTPGHAMRAEDPLKAFGAVIGKALRPLQSGQGLVPMLIALQ